MKQTVSYAAVVLAGRRNDGVFAAVSQAANEALIEIGDRTMLEYVLAALTAAETVGRVVVVGTAEVAAVLPPGVEFVAERGDMIANVVAGVEYLATDEQVVIATSDIPFITPAIVDDFLRQCAARPADLYYPAIPRAAAEAAFPGVQRTYAKLREGTFTGGNMFVVNARLVPAMADRIREFVAARKSPAKMAGLIGPMFAVKLAMGTLSAAELERKVSAMFGVRGVVMITGHSEIGVDVDKLSDLELARRVLAK